MRCFVEPSPAGGYFVRLRGEAAPLSRHDTEEEAEAAAAAYERGLARRDIAEHVVLADGSEVELRTADDVDHGTIEAISAGARVGMARYVRSRERLHVAEATVEVVDDWQGRGLGGKLLRRLAERAAENGIRVFATDSGELPVRAAGRR